MNWVGAFWQMKVPPAGIFGGKRPGYAFEIIALGLSNSGVSWLSRKPV